MSNKIMTSCAYDPKTFRVKRQRSAMYTKSGNTYTPAAGIRLDRVYEYDLMGSVVGENDRTPASAASQGPGSIDRIFGHDPLRRLLSATGRESTAALVQPSWDLNVRPQDYTATNTYTRWYTYDKLSNIKALRHVANGLPANNFNRSYNYQNNNNNKLENFQIGSNTYGYLYDANGNQTKENSDRYFEWNYADKLSFYKRQAGTSDPTVWSHYFYDASGQRIKKVVNKPGGIQEMTVYTCPEAARRVDGVFEHTYVRINNNVDNNRNYNTLHVLDASSGLSAGGNSRIATLRVGNDSQDSTPALKYYVEDHLGNSSVSVQSNGNRINLEEYYPFGETSYGSFAKKRYRYNGKEKDEHTGLYEYGQRYYAPWLCRFVSVDPIAEDYPQLSSYNYAGNKPITSRDIEGLQGTEDSPTKMESKGATVQLPDRGGMPNYLLPEVVVTSSHPESEGATREYPSASINPRDGSATVDFQTYFYHKGLGKNDTQSGWYNFSDYTNRVFDAGKSDGYYDFQTGDTSKPFFSDGRPLADGYVNSFNGSYEAGVSTGKSDRASDMSGKANTTSLEFDVILAIYTLGQGNFAKEVIKEGAEKTVTSIASKSAAQGSKSFVQLSSKTGISKGGQKVFSYQARFPKPNLNVRLDRGFRAPFKNTTSNYLGKPYNGFNTHINIQKPGSFNYHLPLNPLKWKYYNIP